MATCCRKKRAQLPICLGIRKNSPQELPSKETSNPAALVFYQEAIRCDHVTRASWLNDVVRGGEASADCSRT